MNTAPIFAGGTVPFVNFIAPLYYYDLERGIVTMQTVCRHKTADTAAYNCHIIFFHWFSLGACINYVGRADT